MNFANFLAAAGEIARNKGIKSIEVTITHSRDTVMAAREPRKQEE